MAPLAPPTTAERFGPRAEERLAHREHKCAIGGFLPSSHVDGLTTLFTPNRRLNPGSFVCEVVPGAHGIIRHTCINLSHYVSRVPQGETYPREDRRARRRRAAHTQTCTRQKQSFLSRLPARRLGPLSPALPGLKGLRQPAHSPFTPTPLWSFRSRHLTQRSAARPAWSAVPWARARVYPASRRQLRAIRLARRPRDPRCVRPPGTRAGARQQYPQGRPAERRAPCAAPRRGR